MGSFNGQGVRLLCLLIQSAGFPLIRISAQGFAIITISPKVFGPAGTGASVLVFVSDVFFGLTLVCFFSVVFLWAVLEGFGSDFQWIL